MDLRYAMPPQRWTPSDYCHFLMELRLRCDLLAFAEYATGSSGVWLRHDVELSLSAATRMAAVESRQDVPSTYFVCVDSPFFGDQRALTSALIELARLGREVSFHVLTNHQALDNDRYHSHSSFPSVATDGPISFHAPGATSTYLSALPGGQRVYAPIAAGETYYSDSTGNWRYGSPIENGSLGQRSDQILTHPYWWFGDSNVALDSRKKAEFLPQLVSTLEKSPVTEKKPLR